MMFSTDLFGRQRPRYVSKEEPERLLELAHAAWRTMLLILSGTIICATLFGAYLLSGSLGVVSGAVETASPQTQPLSVDQLVQTAKDIRARQDLYEQLKLQPSTLEDPSR